MNDDFIDLQYRVFVVGKRPLCLWGTDIRGDVLRFLDNIDHAYFEHVANTHLAQLNDDAPREKESQFSALAIRTAYSQALETLFALIGALVQAPQCPHAWLDKYRPSELYALVRKMHNRDQVVTLLTNASPGWTQIADLVFASCVLPDKSREEAIRKHFADLWSRFAAQFLDPNFSAEYNAVKHGLRVRLGGFSFRVGVHGTGGEPPQQFSTLGASDFGSSFFGFESVGELDHHLQIRNQQHNWSPEDFGWSLHLIAMSIGNLIASLKILNGVNLQDVLFHWPAEDQIFDETHKRTRQLGVTQMKGGQLEIGLEYIQPMTQDELLARYRAGNDAGVRRLYFGPGPDSASAS